MDKESQAAWDAFAEAEEKLDRYPSVRSLELGWKVSGGKLQPDLAIRVYVDRKLPLNQVPPEDRIPPMIGGLPTDVINVREEISNGHDMIGGDQVTRVVWNEPGSAEGTLGYIATRSADNAAVMLCNQHVFRSKLGSVERRREVYQPDLSQCLGSTCNKVGFVTDGFIGDFDWSPDASAPSSYFIDCAIGQVEDTNYQRGIKGIPSIIGHEDISSTLFGPGHTPITAKKMGAKTGLTQGIVVSVNSTGHQKVGPFEIQDQPLTILIRATDGPIFDETYTVAASEKTSIIDTFNGFSGPGTVTDLGGNRLQFRVPTFGRRGDSGSTVVVSASGRVAGLFYAISVFTFPALEDGKTVRKEVPIGESRACHIGPVMSRLGIRIDPATAPSAGEVALAPGNPIGADVADPLLASRVEVLEQQLRLSRRGRLLCALAREHGREMVDLVHHRRRVTVPWHRHQGPAFAALILDAVRDPMRPIPREHKGIALDSLLLTMGRAFVCEGSPSLGAAIEQNYDWLIEWFTCGDRISELIVALYREHPELREGREPELCEGH